MSVHNTELFDEVDLLQKNLHIAIIVADFNSDITHSIAQKTVERLQTEWFENIDIYRVPWVVELPAMTQLVTEKWIYSLCIIVWCIIKWDFPNYLYQTITKELTTLSTTCKTPLVLWAFTCESLEWAKDMINDNYAVYGINYLIQRTSAESSIDERYQTIMEWVWSSLQDISSNDWEG